MVIYMHVYLSYLMSISTRIIMSLTLRINQRNYRHLCRVEDLNKPSSRRNLPTTLDIFDIGAYHNNLAMFLNI